MRALNLEPRAGNPAALSGCPPMIDMAVIAWNALAGVAWALLVAGHREALLPASLHAAATAGVLACRRRVAAGGAAAWLRAAYPWLVWALAWVELGALHRLSGAAGNDALIGGWDRAWLGGPWHRELAAALPWPWLGEAAGFTYLSYYALIVMPAAVTIARRDAEAFAAATARMVAAYLGCFAISLLLPVLGPRAAEGAGLDGVFAGIGAAMRAAGDAPGTAFPSSHCAGSVMAALVLRRLGAGRMAAWAAPWAAAVVVSTVYTGNHYALDSLAGVGLALALDFTLPRGGGARAVGERSLPCR